VCSSDLIAWDELEDAPGDAEPMAFSELHARGVRLEELTPLGVLGGRFPVLEQIPCKQTRTTGAIHEHIRANIHRAPMFSGQIESIGPRYCPSIEDKVVRFADRDSHGVFLEPESLRDDFVYCNGIATSLPTDVQDAIVRGMPGCERATILRYGYAVEYDMVRPHQILATGETKRLGGLFLAGQINGTSGYEEAAGQGLVAGINAARRVRGGGAFVLGRDEAYLGVLMDDLVTKTPTEPYRMFTSRAEHRLLLRADNAVDRLTPRAIELGLLDSTELGRARRAALEARAAELAALGAQVDAMVVEGAALSRVMQRPEFGFDEFRAAVGVVDRGVALTVFASRNYEPYLRRQESEIRRQRQREHRAIPRGLSREALGEMRPEAREALLRFTPATFGQASRLEGITPADLTLLAVILERRGRGFDQSGAA
ncbi:MAG: FAD-dependent oxidoreductase, partial [Phycisphaerales bacterium JB037]